MAKLKFKDGYQDFGAYALLKDVVSRGDLYVEGNNYSVYTALLTQTGTAAPEATVLENTLGANGSFEYVSPGVYVLNFDKPLFESPNEYVVITGDGGDIEFSAFPVFVANIGVESLSGGVNDDDLLGNNKPCTIEIRKYGNI